MDLLTSVLGLNQYGRTGELRGVKVMTLPPTHMRSIMLVLIINLGPVLPYN